MASDRFGLPPPGEDQESEERRTERRALVAELIREIFSTAVEQVGEAEARRLWVEIPDEQKRKRGRPRKSSLSGWDALLLEMYDELVADPNPQSLIRHMGTFFYQNTKRYQSAQAVERRLRRLLADRRGGKLLREEGEGAIARYRVIPPSRGQ